MTLKMQGLTPHAEVFVRYYQIHVVKKEMSRVDGVVIGHSLIGLCTFIPRKGASGLQSVPFYGNKWDNLTDC